MQHDPVNKPAHYTAGEIECIDAIQASMSQDEFMGWLKGNILKYVWRYKSKGGVEDLKKANFYLNRMIGLQQKPPVAVADTVPTWDKQVYPPPTTLWPPLGGAAQLELIPRNG